MSLYPLPPLVLFEHFGGNWENYRQALYKIFLNSIVDKLTFLNLPVSCRYFQPISDMHRSFWHLISDGGLRDEDRLPNMRRCERISWVAHLINNHRDSELECWENKRGSNKNTVLWLPPENYMVILSQRKDYYLLVTAYTHDPRKEKANRREIGVCVDPRKS